MFSVGEDLAQSTGAVGPIHGPLPLVNRLYVDVAARLVREEVPGIHPDVRRVLSKPSQNLLVVAVQVAGMEDPSHSVYVTLTELPE